MNFNKELIEAVASGKRVDEVKNLPPVAKIHLGLENGLEMDKYTFDDKAIAKVINERNNPKKVNEKK